MQISVCVATIRAESLSNTIAAIQAQTWPKWELILVPQGSDPALLATCAQATRDSRIRVVPLADRGLSRARNHAVGAASGDVLAFTDDDCEPTKTWLHEIAKPFLVSPELELVGGAVIPPALSKLALATCPGIVPAEVTYRPAPGSRPPKGFDWMGANFAVRKSTFDRIGPFDEWLGAGALFPAGEDTDYKLRLERAGAAMHSTPRAVVHHTFGTRAGFGSRRRFQRNYAKGNGAVAAKLSLSGDPRGELWLGIARQDCINFLKRGRIDGLVRAWMRYSVQRSAFRLCRTSFVVGPNGNLQERM